jgi:acetolactate synthase-1/2/3 large subunit
MSSASRNSVPQESGEPAGELLSGGEMIIRALHDEGVEHVFGYPGGAALHIYDAIFKQQAVQHVLVRHEQAAVHMADGYSRASGRCGVALVTSGPGATNAITGIATAFMDSIPLIVISGQVSSELIGTDSFQETDMVGICRPVVKHSFMIRSVEEIPEVMKKAFYIATSGRPGPVVIDVPKDVTDPAVRRPYAYPESVRMRSYSPAARGHSGQIRKAVDLIVAAKRPVVYAGGGVIQGEACEVLTELVRTLGYPITNTLMGLGCYPATDPLFLGMLGMHGTYEANMAMHHADLILAVGARFDDRVTNDPSKFCPDAKIVHIDVDPATISKIVTADVPIVGPAEPVLRDMVATVRERLEAEPGLLDRGAHGQWLERIGAWRERNGLDHDQRHRVGPGESIKPQVVIQSLYRATKGEAYVTSDVGQHQMFAAQYYHFDAPRRWINSGGLGTMGFGLPSAMGVKFAYPDAVVACVTGEGSIQMNIQELSTCTQFGLPVKIVNLNNQALGMVRQWQDMQYGGRHSHSTYQDSLPDFVALAESYGHVGIRVTALEELDAAMDEVFSDKYANRLVFLDVAVDPNEHVYPMAVKGGSMQDMFLSRSDASRADADETNDALTAPSGEA